MMEEVGHHEDELAHAHAHADMVSATPSRAAFLSTGTADYQPPDWACMPLEANMHARLEAYRDSRHCATYMISTKLVNLFGRDQESCDHVLGNPSVSRKHAAIIHDSTGGIYLVDLMSRHGTFVKGKKIPPHDPFLLHEGDSIKFGQSIRMYSLKGATSEGASAPVKKSWGRVKIKAPKISAVLPKMNARPKYAATVVKLVNDICYGTMTDEKMDAFITAVMELNDDEKKDAADLLIEKVHAKFEFYAAHVHKNAYYTTVALLKRNMLVEEFDSNLGLITLLSQQRHDSIYRSNARKILQFLAAVRLDPDNVHSPIPNPYAVNDPDHHPSEEVTCPPTTNHMGARERVLSDEGKKLFLAGHGYAPPAAAAGVNGHGHESRKVSGSEHDMPQHSRQGSYGSTQYGDDDDDTASQASGYQPPAPWQPPGYNPTYRQPTYAANGHTNGTSNGANHNGYQERRPEPQQPQPQTGSAFGFMAQTQASPPVAQPVSAFGFIASAGADADDAESEGRPSATGFDFIGNAQAPTGPTPPRVRAEDFLVPETAIDQDEFNEMWESTNDSEEWAVELLDSFEVHDLQTSLDQSRIKFVSSDKVSGMQQLLFCAEQQTKDTVFLVEIMLMPGHSEMTVTFKWIVNSLLYENGHDLFIELFKYVVDGFCDHDAQATDSHEATSTSSSYYAARPTMHQLAPQEAHSSVGAEEAEEEDFIPVLDYLTENPVIEPAKFEQLWTSAAVIGSVESTLSSIPDKDTVIAALTDNRLGCLASGAVQNFVKFYFFGEMLELQCFFCVEMVIDTNSGAVTGTIKRFAFQARVPEEEEQIDASFVDFLDKIVHAL